MTANNVVKFPKSSSKQNMEEFLETNKTRFAENLVDHYGTQLLGKLATHGIDVDNPAFILDYIFAMEALRASILRSLEVEHPLHELLNSNDIAKYLPLDPDVTKKS